MAVLPGATLALVLYTFALGYSGTVAFGDQLGETGTLEKALLNRFADAVLPFQPSAGLPALDGASGTKLPRYKILVRYVPGTTDDQRLKFEEKHLLYNGDIKNERKDTWEYDIGWMKRDAIRSIVESTIVEDTHFIDRTNFSITDQSYLIHLLRLYAHGVNDAHLVLPLLCILYVGVILSVVTAFLWPLLSYAGNMRSPPPWAQQQGRVLFVHTWMTFFAMHLIVRHDWDTRLPDIAPMLGVTVGLTLFFLGRTLPGQIGRVLGPAVYHGFFLSVLAAAFSFGLRHGNMEQLIENSLVQERPLVGRIAANIAEIRYLGPKSTPTSEPLLQPRRGVARYVSLCTDPDARLLLTSFVPEIPYWANRLVAGGRLFHHAGWGPVGLSEVASLEILGRQRVPIIIHRATNSLQTLADVFPLLKTYIDQNYTLAGQSAFDRPDGEVFQVFLRNGISASDYVTQDGARLPCPSPQ